MALTNIQVEELAKRMSIPLERCCFKSELEEEPLKYNRSYIINLKMNLVKMVNEMMVVIILVFK